MHKRLVNELHLQFDILPCGPMLIKSGHESGGDPTLLDMNFVRSHSAGYGWTVYLPGSSLRGVVRSYCEKIGRTVGLEVCDPLGDRSCGRLAEQEARGAKSYEIHKQLCPMCRLFGHTVMASRIQFADAYPTEETLEQTNWTEERDGVAIDRVSGAVAVGPFQLEVVTRGAFRAHLMMHNYQLWQVGLLAIALRDMAEGRVPLGYGKSRGLGQVNIQYRDLEISYPGQFPQRTKYNFGAALYGVTAFEIPEEYGFVAEDPLPLNPHVHVDLSWGRAKLRFEGAEAVMGVLEAAVQPWANYVSASTGA